MQLIPVSRFVAEAQVGEDVLRYQMQRSGDINSLQVVYEQGPEMATAELYIQGPESSRTLTAEFKDSVAQFSTEKVQGQDKLYLSLKGDMEGDVTPFGGIWISFFYRMNI